MRKWVSTSAKSVLLTAGFVALGSGVAFADSEAVTSGNGSLLGGNQAVVNGDIPVNVSGNAVGAVLGTAGASSTDTGAAVVDHQHGPDAATSGNGSAVGGNQLVADGEVPVNVSGNAIAAVASLAGASSTDDGAAVVHQSAPEAQPTALGSLPLVEELPEVPVSDMLPVNYEVSETTRQAVEQHAPEHADELPESAPVGVADPVNELLGAAGVGL